MSEFKSMLTAGIIVFALMFVFLVWLPGMDLKLNFSPSGNFLANSDDRYMHTLLAEDKWVGSALFPIADTEGTVKDGPDGEKGLLLPFRTEQNWFGDDGLGLVELTVMKADDGELIMSINGGQIYRGTPTTGKHYVNFDKDVLTGEDVLEIKAENGAAFWSNAKYDVRAEIKGEIPSIINATFLTPATYKKAKLIASVGSSEGRLTVRLNGQTVFEGEPDNMLNIELTGLRKANQVEFTAETGAKHLFDWAEIRFER